MKKKKRKSEDKRAIITEIENIESHIHKQIEIKKILYPALGFRKFTKNTEKLVKDGFDYIIDIEEHIRRDFFFEWLPHHIKKYLGLLVPIIAMFTILYIPINVDINIKKALALFVCIALLWVMESLSMIVTALLIPVLAVLLGLIKNSNPFQSFSNPIIYLLLSGLILGQAFRKHNLDKLIAVKMLSMSKGHLRTLLFYNMLMAGILGMWMSNTATMALLIPVILSVSHELQKKTEKNITGLLLLSAGFGASILSLMTIIGANPYAIAAALIRNTQEFGFFDWTAVGFPVAIVLFIIAYLIFVKFYGIKDESFGQEIIESDTVISLNRNQKKVLAIFFPTILLWLFGGKISAVLSLPIDFYRTEIIGLSAAILLFAFKILRWNDVRKIPWEIFLLVGGGLTLGQILTDTGTAAFMADRLFAVLFILPKFLSILLIVFLAILLANFVNNSSATIILVPIILNLPASLGLDRILLALAATMATAISPLTPIAIPSFSLIYGTGFVSRKEMIHLGLIISSICGIALTLMVYLLNLM
ncbi:MAG: DASS family sodium-coupled anion symporter [Nanoarchaeota archaeon]|nr:DASS family sodium-coupled anion symporter [Nanoarchaeota archaeon]